MKSLLEVQQDIRNLEHSINDITAAIKKIDSDMENLRSDNINTNIDSSKILLLSKQITFKNHPIGELDNDQACRIYLEMLLNIVRMDSDEELALNRLIFIQWIQKESQIDWSLEDLFKDSYKISRESYQEVNDIIPKKYKEFFIVDALIIANIGGAANAEINEYIVGLTSILNIDKNNLHLLSLVARVALCQDAKCVKKSVMSEFMDCAKDYKHYIKMNILKKEIASMRRIIVQIQNKEVAKFNWEVTQGQCVKKNDVVATFTYSFYSDRKEVKTPYAGTIYKFKYNHTNYGVLALKQDNVDSIKEWVKARG